MRLPYNLKFIVHLLYKLTFYKMVLLVNSDIIPCMILATHSIVGATVANIFPGNPLLGFTLGFASHFLVDAIPHWHYPLATITDDKETGKALDKDMVINEHFVADLLKIGVDAMLGILVASLFLNVSQPYFLSSTLVGAAGGMLPDALQFLYWKWRHQPLLSLQRFHLWIHSKNDLDDRPVWGPVSQIILSLSCILLLKLLQL